MIRGFLFDYDGVISQGVDVALPAKRLANNIGISQDEATKIIKSIWDDYSTGKSTIEEVWALIENQIRTKVPVEKRNIWHTWDELRPLPEMLNFIQALKLKGYPVGLVSNVFKETADMIRNNGGYKIFTFTILSCDVGYRKPNSKIYESAMKKLPGLQPNEVLFLDDREHCIVGAEAFGLQTIHVKNHQQAIAQVMGLINNPAARNIP